MCMYVSVMVQTRRIGCHGWRAAGVARRRQSVAQEQTPCVCRHAARRPDCIPLACVRMCSQARTACATHEACLTAHACADANRRRSGQEPNSSLHAKLRRAQVAGDLKQRSKIHGMGISNGLGLAHEHGAVGAMVSLNLNPQQAGVGAGEVCRKRLLFHAFTSILRCHVG
jgi:hypothetical protein